MRVTMDDLHTQFFLDALEEGYNDIGNPLFAWEALKICCEECLSIPGWALKYFEETSSNLLDVADKARNPDDNSKKRPSTEIPKALKMNQRGSIDVFDQYIKYHRNQELVRKVCQLIIEKSPEAIEDGRGIMSIIEEVSNEKLNGLGENYVSWPTIYSLYRKWREKVLMEDN
jgi:hypothetical protein